MDPTKHVKSKPRYTAAQIVLIVKQMHRDGQPLNISAIREKHPDLLLAAFSQKPFLGWRGALEMAGIQYSDIKIRLSRFVKCQMCGARLQNLRKHIRIQHGMSANQYLETYPGAMVVAPAAEHHFRQSCHCAIPHWEWNWSPEYVLDRVNRLYLNKVPLNSRKLIKMEPSILLRGKQYFGRWETVLELAGLDPRKIVGHHSPTKWTKDEVRRVILNGYGSGWDISHSGIMKHNPRVLWGARKLFGSYDGALLACGLNPAKIRKQPRPARLYRSQEDVIRAICRRRLKDQPIHDCGLRIGPNKDLSLWNKARRLFGVWSKAVEAAGFNYAKICPRTPKYKTADEVIAGIALRKKQGLGLSAKAIRRGEARDHNLYAQGCRFFKTWERVLKAAGIRHKEILKCQSRYPTKETVLKGIHQRASMGLPLTIEGMRKSESRDLGLYQRALKHFGSWAIALAKARVENPGVSQMRKYPTAESVLAGIRRRRKQRLPLTFASVHKGEHADSPLHPAALRFFGSWAKTIEYAGFDYATVRAEEVLAKRRRQLASGHYATSIATTHDVDRCIQRRETPCLLGF